MVPGTISCGHAGVSHFVDYEMDRLTTRSTLAFLLSCNIGIPVPREPFSFGGLYGTKSKYGDIDITGDAGMEFFSNRIKITSKWPLLKPESHENGGTDHANFAGTM